VRLRSLSLSTRFFGALVVLLAALGAAVVVAVYGLGQVQSANTLVYEDTFLTEEATSNLAVELSRADVAAVKVTLARTAADAAARRTELDQIVIPQVNEAIDRVVELHQGDDPEELRTIDTIRPAWQRFLETTHRGVLASGASTPGAASADRAAINRTLEPLLTFVRGLQRVETQEASEAHTHASDVYRGSVFWLVIAAGLTLLSAFGMIRIGIALRGLVERQSSEQRYADSDSRYVDALQVTENEEEAQELLRRHVEQALPGASAVVLARNNSADRLEPKTSLDALDPLRVTLVGAGPRSCLAVRFGRGHIEGGQEEPLMSCGICGKLPGVSTCEPLLVSGEVIGSVLTNQETEPGERARKRLRDAVGQAAPVMANLRNLAIAQLRAATDVLTGLPNQRAVQDTLKRLVAQAYRTMTPLSALLVDLDHFKQVNDVYGHETGDAVLAAVGATLGSLGRTDDFVGRYGGEEFLVLLPDTDRAGALALAEALRRAIAAVSVPNMDTVTASVGVAVLGEDAQDGTALFRAADRALYAAKRNGRNRVESADAHRDPQAEAA
jgi:diguanylate cyclase (GGDEF)-like protein